MDIQELVTQPRESLAVELKGWIDPDSSSGIEKLVKATIAMRNNNGGYILIGFDNDTCQPLHENIPPNVQELFHQDKIQGLITKYASESFEIKIYFQKINDNILPVIEIGSGVRSPVGTKRDFIASDGKTYIQQNKVYVRSLRSNNTPSTTEATWKDWEPLVERCFDNREADIGRFLRRQIGGLDQELLHKFSKILVSEIQSTKFEDISLQVLQQNTVPPQAETIEEDLNNILQIGLGRYETIVAERQLKLPEFGTWEVAAIIKGNIPPHSTNSNFLNLLDASNPNYTGWPVWLDSRGFNDETTRPWVFESAWEAFIYISDSAWVKSLDFWRLDPKGKFYLLRSLEDDSLGGDRGPEPLTALDFGLPILRTAEAIAVALAFAKSMGCDQEQTSVAFRFKWTHLQGRHLNAWAHPQRHIFSHGKQAYQDELVSDVTVPLDTPDNALAQYVERAVKPLLEIFGGFTVGFNVIEDMVQKIISRRW